MPEGSFRRLSDDWIQLMAGPLRLRHARREIRLGDGWTAEEEVSHPGGGQHLGFSWLCSTYVDVSYNGYDGMVRGQATHENTTILWIFIIILWMFIIKY